ncbi:MAG: hypothetical protein SPJ04_07440 [Bdellovibrionota bacterium]|nr:hypothetical protein [Pseudomonadota bacterium]MDY6091068.1 hypothetical protein [Bdellovibrionota bacterium]
MKKYNMKTKILGLLFLVFLTSCYYKITNYPSLVNQGILPVSKEQAYVGANLFLSREMEQSTFLYNFLKKRGAPDAIEIVRRSFNNDRFFLYYYDAKEVYIADPKILKNNRREWIIKGPRIPNWRDLKNIRNVMDTSKKDTPFLIDGKEMYFSSNVNGINRSNIIENDIDSKIVDVSKLPKVPPQRKIVRKKYTPQKKVVKKVSTEVKKTQSVEAPSVDQSGNDDFLKDLEDLTTYKPINLDKMAIAMSKGYARRDNMGNVVHTVKSYTETLQAISFWYTGNEINAVEIEKFNSLEDASNLKIGQNILIPFRMLKNVKQMPN